MFFMRWKQVLLFSVVFFIALSSMAHSPDYFERQLADLVFDFKKDIMEESKCNELILRANSLEREVSNLLKSNEGHSSNNVSEFNKFLTEVKAIKHFIAALTCRRNYVLTIDMLYLANKRIGANIGNINSGEYCIDLYRMVIDEYKAYIIMNHTESGYKVSYEWSLECEMSKKSGHGDIGTPKKSVRRLINNRDGLDVDNVIINTLVCI